MVVLCKMAHGSSTKVCKSQISIQYLVRSEEAGFNRRIELSLSGQVRNYREMSS